MYTQCCLQCIRVMLIVNKYLSLTTITFGIVILFCKSIDKMFMCCLFLQIMFFCLIFLYTNVKQCKSFTLFCIGVYIYCQRVYKTATKRVPQIESVLRFKRVPIVPSCIWIKIFLKLSPFLSCFHICLSDCSDFFITYHNNNKIFCQNLIAARGVSKGLEFLYWILRIWAFCSLSCTEHKWKWRKGFIII